MKRFAHILFLLMLMAPTVAFSQSVKGGNEVREEQQQAGKANAISISFSGNYLYLSGVKEGTKVEVMNMLGVPVLSVETTNDDEKISLDLKKGFYVVRVENIVQRIVIK
ncbi:MAG: T9SS type A sorting domain-containing protein [Paludibacteraceae bacterium]|nr:T9SS type A sorting domain-containing protein [Paludibacteraceae bacterium]MBP5480729.1 T9SS type A sorting domain-containing protein [Paludibacteraceae bacterium]MBR4814683.1 T9SS type A sorting domain-containing protein [Paludibacteraceae bacterium]